MMPAHYFSEITTLLPQSLEEIQAQYHRILNDLETEAKAHFDELSQISDPQERYIAQRRVLQKLHMQRQPFLDELTRIYAFSLPTVIITKPK
jgi:hypothetical protein